MKTIALTGGIGSGKTTVSKIFSSFKIPVISADSIALNLTTINTHSYKKILSHFGNTILTSDSSQLDRKKLRDIIFSNLEAKIWLEQLLQPLIKQEIFTQITQLAATSKYLYCIIEIPLLFEAGMEKDFEHILLITCDQNTQLCRTAARDKTTYAKIANIINHQSNPAKNLALVDDIVENNTSLGILKTKIAELHAKYSSAIISL